MAKPKYAIGIDFGTESGRALLVDVADGREVATAVHTYANGVIDEKLPDSDVRLEPDWALQDPNDYLEVFKRAVPAVLQQSGVDPADVIGLGIDFTACTMMPVKKDGTPVTGRSIHIAGTHQGGALGSAMHGAVAAGGYDSIVDAAHKMARLRDESYHPIPAHQAIYDRLFAEYVTLHDYFGRGANDVMKRLKALKTEMLAAQGGA